MPKRIAAAAALILIAALGLAQCDHDRTPPPATEAPAPAATAPVQTSLSRADLVSALAQAASAYAAGTAVPEEAAISGRTFDIVLPFGCEGAQTAATPGLARWSRTADGRDIVLTVTPADWSVAPFISRPASAGGAETWDAVEGFWIARPWLSADACPRAPARLAAPATPVEGRLEIIRPLPLPPSPLTAGLAIIRGADTSRLGRRPGASYSFTVRGEADAPAAPPADGYRLRLTGRIGAFPDGQAMRCRADSPDRRPVCVAAVDMDVVAFETASGDRLSEWRPS